MNSRFPIVEPIEPCIQTIRKLNVMLDSDLAKIYGVSTKRLNEQVKRNKERFPSDFVFRLTRSETVQFASFSKSDAGKSNRSQNATGSQKHRNPRHAPYVFTEHGAIMAATILNSKAAIKMSVFVVRAFVKMRAYLIGQSEMEKRLTQIENVLLAHDHQILDLFRKIRPLLLPPPDPAHQPIGFHVREGKARYQINKRAAVTKNKA